MVTSRQSGIWRTTSILGLKSFSFKANWNAIWYRIITASIICMSIQKKENLQNSNLLIPNTKILVFKIYTFSKRPSEVPSNPLAIEVVFLPMAKQTQISKVLLMLKTKIPRGLRNFELDTHSLLFFKAWDIHQKNTRLSYSRSFLMSLVHLLKGTSESQTALKATIGR